MLPRSNAHTHTIFSDGKNTPEEIVQAALKKGFISLGFSDHGVCTLDGDGMRDETGYCAEIECLKSKYADQIEIALGCEHEALTNDADLSLFDCIIESVHFLYKDGVYTPVDVTADILKKAINRDYGGDPYAMCRDYFDRVNRSIDGTKADVLGHLDVITGVNETGPLVDHTDTRYTKYANETVALAAERGIIVEINSGAMSRGYRSAPYPYSEQLRLLHELGGKITITSDCHSADCIDFGFDKSIEIAESAGFTESWIWKDGCFRPYKL